MTRRPCVSLTRPRKLQFHWKGSADVTYESFAAATVTVRYVESKITRNQGCFPDIRKTSRRLHALCVSSTGCSFSSLRIRRTILSFFIVFFFGYRRARKTKFVALVHERRERANDRIVARRKNGMEIMPMPMLTMHAFSVFYTRLTFDQSVQNKA